MPGKREEKVELPAEPLPLRFVLRHPTLKRVAQSIARRVGPTALQTGRPISTYGLVARCLFFSLLSLPLIPLGLGLSPVSPLFLLLCPVPVLIFLLPLLILKSQVGDRRRGQEEELPMFAVYASVLQSAGISLYRALRGLTGKEIFRELRQDGERMGWMEKVGQLEALEEVGRSSPSEKFRNFILGYTSELRSGGDATRYLEAKASELLREEEAKWKRYVDHVTNLGEVFLSLLLLVPLAGILLCFLSPESSTALLLVPTLLIPAVTVLGIGITRSIQPKFYDELESPWVLPLLSALLVLAGLLLAGLEPWLALTFSLSAGLILYGLPVYLQQKVISAEESGMVEFLRDITEYVKMGYNLPTALRKLQSRDYNRHFNRLLRYVVSELDMNTPLSEVDPPTRSWVVRVGFFQLGSIWESGGYNPRSLELLTSYLSSILHYRREAVRGLSIYRGISLATPLILAASMAMMTPFFQGTAYETFGAPAPFALGGIPAWITAFCGVVVLLSALSTGLLCSFTVGFTMRSTLLAGVNVLLGGMGLLLLQ